MRLFLIAGVLAAQLFAQTPATTQAPTTLDRRVRAEMGFLASDAMQGRGSAGPYEAVAADYLASEMLAMGLAPAGDSTSAGRSFIQQVPFKESKIVGNPTLAAGDQTWTHGKGVAVNILSGTKIAGPLEFWADGKTIKKGSVVFLTGPNARKQVQEAMQAGAVATLIGYSETSKQRFEQLLKATPELVESLGYNNAYLSAAATESLQKMPEGTTITFAAEAQTIERMTRNVIGMIAGQTDAAITVSAHFDHLGVAGTGPDTIYNGADDDASGTVTVLELARALVAKPKPKRTVYFILFGSEELGGIGSKYFEQHPPLPIEKIVADIQFEMLGAPDPKVAPAMLWITGFDRSDLAPTLKQHGASIAADPYPDQNFFERSDNFSLAKRGVVAHTVSSYALHPQYHQPNDDIAHIDFAHLERSIASMMAPLEWFVNSDFKPQWLPGKKP